jgi:two-component system, OmpR family, KDP operon response regulator KdpE
MKILVIDHDPEERDAMTVGFQFQWQDAAVVPAGDGEAGLQEFHRLHPNVVVLEATLPGRDGFEVLREIRLTSDVPVIMVAAGGGEAEEVRGLEMGADGYVSKPFGQLELLARVKAVLRRAMLPSIPRSTSGFVCGGVAIDFSSRTVAVRAKPVRLTPVEYRLLCLLVRNCGRTVSHRALLSQIWGEDSGTTTHLKVFVSRLRSKIDAGGGAGYIRTDRGVGYRFVPPVKEQV